MYQQIDVGQVPAVIASWLRIRPTSARWFSGVVSHDATWAGSQLFDHTSVQKFSECPAPPLITVEVRDKVREFE